MSTQQAPEFIVVPLTGIQICRRLPLDHVRDDQGARDIWKAAEQLGEKSALPNALLPLIAKYIACREDESVEKTRWIACAAHAALFFRLLHIGANYFIDMVVDTQSGAGRTANNKIPCIVESGMRFLSRKQHHLASFFVENHTRPKNVEGDLIVDFGNTGSAFIFAPAREPPESARPVVLNNPLDQFCDDETLRPKKDRSILKSTAFVLWVPESDVADPWLVLGKRAEELIAELDPLITSLYAPKKYVVHWAEHLKAEEPTTQYHGLVGARSGLFPKLFFVEQTAQNMLQLVLSSLTNPNFSSPAPVKYPQVRQVLLTYPLTWRKADRELFVQLVRQAAEKLFVLEDRIKKNFKVELVCSEPVAVAAYVLWEVLFQFLPYGDRGINLKTPSLASSMLGNNDGSPLLRVLVVDIGGGSTDIALVEAAWSVSEEEGLFVDVRFRELESLCFNRAGDRISHIMATAILEFMKEKYRIKESLGFEDRSAQAAFTVFQKRPAVSEIMKLVDEAKAQLAKNGKTWILEREGEKQLLDSLALARDTSPTEPVEEEAVESHMEISLQTLRKWIEADRQSPQTHGEPGFMDIFYHLEQLGDHVRENNQSPHLVVLSGRTTRLAFIKEMTAQHLQMPLHRVRQLSDFLPKSLQGPDHANMDKLAVVYGAHRFRFNGQIRFHPHPKEAAFTRYLGTAGGTALGMRLNRVLVEPGASQPKDCVIRIQPGGNVLIGHAFRKDGPAEVLADLTNQSNDWREVQVELTDDYAVALKKTIKNNGIVLTERVPGGTKSIVDNFSDTGRIDSEPEGFLAQIVLKNRGEWIKPTPAPAQE